MTTQTHPLAIVTGASSGFEAMMRMRGEGQVVTGWQNELQATISHIAPSGVLAELHREQAAPGTAAPR